MNPMHLDDGSISYGHLATAIAQAVEQALHDGTGPVEKSEHLHRAGNVAYELVAARLARETGVPVVVTLVIERAAGAEPPAEVAPEHFRLTRRESMVANLIREGRPNASIAAVLSISSHTVKRHVERILAKLDVRTRTQAAAVAHRAGLAGEAAGAERG